MFFILSQKALAFTFLQTFFHRLLSPPTPYTALLSLLSVALSSVTAKSNFMILPDACCVNIQPARKACSISAESVLNFAGLAAQSLRRTHSSCRKRVMSVVFDTQTPRLPFREGGALFQALLRKG